MPAQASVPVAVGLAIVVVVALLVLGRGVRRGPPTTVPVHVEAMPALHLRTADPDAYVVPSVIAFPAAGRLRLGYQPSFMDAHVGDIAFSRVPAVAIRGDQASVRELSRHAACIWRDAQSGACFVQLGWPGPGEPIRPRTQTRVLRFGRPQDAASQPFRLAHGDVLRLSAQVEYVFCEVEPLRDRPTPEQKKIDAFEAATGGTTSGSGAPSTASKLSLLGRTRPRPTDPSAGDDLA
jgi:hypothetical protein